MRTTASIPNDLFHLAETKRKELRLSRSQLYEVAVREFLNRYEAKEITARLNQIYSANDATVDSALMFTQLKALQNDPW